MRRKGATGGHPKPKKPREVKPLLYVKYGCPAGHIRIEKEKLVGQLPFCTTCHMTKGEYVRIKYISTKRGYERKN